MHLTVLPSIIPECKDHVKLPFTGGCRDLVFSGHTGLAILIILFLINEDTINSLVGGFIGFGLIIAILIGRHHYTLDIILAVITSFLIFDNRSLFDNIYAI
jgi:hypothetical protein